MVENTESGIQTGEVSAVSQYPPLSDEEVKKVALGSLHGQVFGTWMLEERDARLIPSIFMVMAFMDDIALKEMKRDGIVHLYEWWDRAGPRSINGFPSFMSCRMLNAEDSLRIQNKMNEIKEALDAL